MQGCHAKIEGKIESVYICMRVEALKIEKLYMTVLVKTPKIEGKIDSMHTCMEVTTSKIEGKIESIHMFQGVRL